MATAGTVTLMFTDVVGSTELLGRLGEERAEEVMGRHFASLRVEAERTRGREVKSLGDGLMIAFASAVDAVECAAAMQRATAGADDGLGLRVGIHAGEPSHDGEDYFGSPVVIARRLCDRAGSGEVLVSEVVRGLVGRRGDHRFERLGEVRLKGIDEPVAACVLRWDAEQAGAVPVLPDEQPPLPAALMARRPTAFVGRTDALARLVARFDESREGRLRLVALSGEPGIGKTRLAKEFATLAHGNGALVLFGRTDEEGFVPYQPFAEAIRGYLQAVPGATAAAHGLGNLLPELEHRSAPDADPGLQRYLLFEAVTAFLATLSRKAPVVLVLDDLHWADAPTLLLLRHLVRGSGDVPLLVLATYRETDLSRRHPLAEALADLRRDNLVERLPLRGLTQQDVADLLEQTAGHGVPAAFARAMHEETEGNPFFLEEVVRHLVETGAIYESGGKWRSDVQIEQMGIPEGVREAVGRRLARLSETCNRALTAAAVIGRSWEYEVLAEMVDATDDELLDAVEEALAAQLVVESDNGGHAFTHALVRETLYEELSLPRRQRMHLRAAEAIERRHARDLDAQASALALHLHLAGAAADPAKALEWSMRAAGVAAAALAWEEAVSHLERAAEYMEDLGSPPADRARVLERAADLRYVAGFDLEGAVRHLEQALEAYEAAGLPDRAARVHSRIARDRATFIGPTHDLVAARRHIEAARPVLASEPPGAAMGFLLIADSTTLLWELDMPGSQAAAEEAMAIGERLGNRVLWSNAAVLAGNALGARGSVGAAGALVEQAWQEADRLNHPWVAFLSSWTLAGMAIWVNGPRETIRVADRELTKPRVAGAAGQRSFLTLFRGQGYMCLGDLAEAERSVAETSPPQWGLDIMVSAYTADRETTVRRFEEFVAESRAVGSRWTDAAVGFRMAELMAAIGDPRAAEILDGYAGMTRAAEHRVIELHTRALAAAYSPRWDRREHGLAHLRRCREIVEAGEGWASLEARVEWAAGALAGDEAEAEACFGRALTILEELEMPLLRAEVLRGRGHALMPRSPERAVDSFEQAIAIYEQVGASPGWSEDVRADRERAAALV